MRCLSCGAEDVARKRFCEDCGAPLELTCATCGNAIGAGKKFCGDCGTPVEPAPVDQATTEAAPPAPPAEAETVVAERRMCSVLFCDLVGFTTLSEDRDPESVRELLDSYFELTRQVIARHGGIVEKFIGDAVMAVWGTPVAQEHDAERAVRAALELVEAVAQLGAGIGTNKLAARAGVVTGVVAVNLAASGQGMVAGDAVNTAARIQAIAEPGSVLFDEGTRQAVGEAVAVVSAGTRAVKGKEHPITLWRVDRVLSGIGGSQRVDGLEAPLVGRNAELRLVKELFHASAERRTPKLVSVVGAAGVGKSRLGWEFEKYVDGLVEPVWWHRGRCLSYGDGVAFSALAEMVRQRFAIAEDDSPTVAGSKLREGLPQFVSDPGELAYVAPRLGQLLGVEADAGAPALSREELFAGWRLFIERLAASGPVVLLVEDVQYADSGFLDFLEHLLEWSRDVPIFVLTLARPELEVRRTGWAMRRGNSTAVSLDPLDQSAMGKLLDGLVPGMPAAAKAAVAGRAEGMPLYAVETVRMLIDREVVQPIDGVYRLVGDVGDLAVPATLHSLLAARLDAFDPDTRRLIADASILGGSFPREALVAICDLPAEQVDRVIEDLVHREVLAVRADPLSPERGQYAFVQAMFREVAIDTQSRRDRKARHLAVAAHLESGMAHGGDETSELVASHVLDAIAAVPDSDDVSGLRERAVTMLIRAGERAERTGAPAAAATSYARAGELLVESDGADSHLAAAELWERAGRCSVSAANPASVDLFGKAAAIYREHARPRAAARVDTTASSALTRLGRFEEAEALLLSALTVLEAELDGDTVEALGELAYLQVFSGNPHGGEVAGDALSKAQELDLPDAVFARLLHVRGLAMGNMNRPVEAAAYMREALRRADASGNASVAGNARVGLSDILLSFDPAAAIVEARASIAETRRIGHRPTLVIATCNLFQAMLLTGAWTELDELGAATPQDGLENDPVAMHGILLLRALRGDTAGAESLLPDDDPRATTEDPQDIAERATALAALAMSRGDHQTAFQQAQVAVEQTESIGLGSDASRWAWPIAANAALAMRMYDAARELVDWLDGHPRGHRPPLLRAESARIRARLLAEAGGAGAAGDAGGPAAAFAAAIKELRDLGSPYHLAVGLLDQADFLALAGELAAASEVADEARVIAEGLRARPLVDRALRLAPVEVPGQGSDAEPVSIPAT